MYHINTFKEAKCLSFCLLYPIRAYVFCTYNDLDIWGDVDTTGCSNSCRSTRCRPYSSTEDQYVRAADR